MATPIALDEEKGKEKKVANYILVQATDIEHALINLKTGFRDMTVDWDVTTISETLIMDVFKYFDQDEDIPAHLKPVTSKSKPVNEDLDDDSDESTDDELLEEDLDDDDDDENLDID